MFASCAAEHECGCFYSASARVTQATLQSEARGGRGGGGGGRGGGARGASAYPRDLTLYGSRRRRRLERQLEVVGVARVGQRVGHGHRARADVRQKTLVEAAHAVVIALDDRRVQVLD